MELSTSKLTSNLEELVAELSEPAQSLAREALDSSLHTDRRIFNIGKLSHCTEPVILKVLDELDMDPQVAEFSKKTRQFLKLETGE